MLDPELPAVSGILLAGGRSTRFGRDKLSATLHGRPLVHHALEILAVATDEVVVVLAPDSRELPLPDVGVPVRIAHDPIAFGGPLVGLLAGLEATSAPRAVVMAADMPSVPPVLLERMADGLSNREIDAVTLLDGDRRRPLPVALRVGAAIPAARGLRDEGEGSIRALLAVLPVLDLGPTLWQDLDPEGRWRHDVDRPEDLTDATNPLQTKRPPADRRRPCGR